VKDERLSSVRNSFNVLRLLLATMVLIKHAEDLTGLPGIGGPGKIDIGTLAVLFFFSISGYLVTPGLVKDGIWQFLLRRFARIYPAYILIILSLTFIFAPLWSYLETGKVQFPVKYIFLNIVPFPQSPVSPKSMMNQLNGLPHYSSRPGIPDAPLWSLALEITCYLALAMLAVMSNRSNRFTFLQIIATVVFLFWVISLTTSWAIKDFLTKNASLSFQLLSKWPYILCFLIGILLARIPINKWKSLYLLPIALFATWYSGDSTFKFALFGALSVSVAAVMVGESSILARVPLRLDISYGIYLFHFPVAQSLIHFSTFEKNLVLLIFMTFVISVIFAYLSSKLVEAPAKRMIREWGSRYL